MSKRAPPSVPFLIDHLDPLAQGVSRHEGIPLFIPKTLPKESGTCKIYKTSKGVAFAYPPSLDQIEIKSPDRINPSCPHYFDCPGCHYLHTTYEQEIQFKEAALTRYLRQSITPDFKIVAHKAKNRDHYRNRLQLHYDRVDNRLGFIDRFQNRIIETKNCQLPNKSLAPLFEKVFTERPFLSAKIPARGHLEIYELNGTLSLTYNEDYASGGFSQVNEEMNHEMIVLIEALFPHTINSLQILDLFGGNGNLSATLPFSKCLVVDTFKPRELKNSRQEFFQQNLYESRAIPALLERVKNQSFDLLLIDPPRSGFKELSLLAESVVPQKILYVSCNAATLSRDILPLKEKYELTAIHLFDLFPSTLHFESVVLLTRK